MKLDVIVERNQSDTAEAPLSSVPETENGGSKNNNPSTIVPSGVKSIYAGSNLVLMGLLGFWGVLISIM
ncbi:hypothetical protein HanRHA438_Chr09g0395581 [Helianthus annuus]|nr:hypothetical protein HanHA300_Chr09g0315191 [Helianthus annuus]KAJ0542095.1 hypothetical protein HanHA89_Chr09g0336051 [Helianthus annuus]KAJ0887852.1 hypothetical protein HanRHA438_Chr09g0395581 [Helianthus annuus]